MEFPSSLYSGVYFSFCSPLLKENNELNTERNYSYTFLVGYPAKILAGYPAKSLSGEDIIGYY